MFVPSMNISLFGKRLANAFSVSVDDVPMGFSGIFLTHFSDFMKDMDWLKKAETEGLVKGLNELAQKLDVIASVIFTLMDVKGESESKH